MSKVIIIGAGSAGLGAAYSLKKQGHEVLIIDKRESIGGLCGSFEIQNFTFDRFVHVSFAKNQKILDLYNQSCSIRYFSPKIFNRYKDIWIPHPVQYNLFKLPLKLRLSIIKSYLKKNKYNLDNYQNWVYRNYGKKLADTFNIPYTRLYWRMNPEEMDTGWLKGRMYDLSLKQLMQGAFLNKEKYHFYADQFMYPNKGGFASFYNIFKNELNIKLNTEVTGIDYNHKTVFLSNNSTINYDFIVNTSPLKEMNKLIKIEDKSIINAINKLQHTSGYIVSLGLTKDPSYKDSLFFYNYNEDILSARIYFPHKKSPFNCPENRYSMQIEIYTKNGQTLDTNSLDFKHTISEILNYCKLNIEDVIFTDIKFEKYANIIFDKNIYEARSKILDFLNKINIKSIGRFGEWDYLWSFQCLEHGLNISIP